jgi:hypothetical protein
LTGALQANGGFSCDGTKFVVVDGTGNTSIGGTLTVSDSKATSLSGTLGVTGATTLGSTLAVTGATTLGSELVLGQKNLKQPTTQTISKNNKSIEFNTYVNDVGEGEYSGRFNFYTGKPNVNWGLKAFIDEGGGVSCAGLSVTQASTLTGNVGIGGASNTSHK